MNMKRWFSLILAVMLVLSAVPSLAAADYTLQEKMQRQTRLYNGGLKGTVEIAASGEAEWAGAAKAFNGVQFGFRAIQTTAGWQTRIWAQDGEAERGTTLIWQNKDGYMASSELLPDQLFSMDRTDGGNPEWFSAAMNLIAIPAADWEARWAPALAGVTNTMELWLGDFASEPAITTAEDGSVTMVIRYEIPESESRGGMVTMLSAVLENESLMTLLGSVCTPEQMALYLNPALLPAYKVLIDGMELDGDVVLERETSARGQDQRVTATLPVSIQGFSSLTIDQQADGNTFTLKGEAVSLTVVMKDEAHGILRIVPNELSEENKALSAAFSLSSEHSATIDADEREHDNTVWTLVLTPDLSHLEENAEERAFYAAFAPVTASLTMHYSSKSAQSSPTTLEIIASAVSEEGQVTVKAVTKTASPWDTEELPDSDGENILTMDSERSAEVLGELGESFLSLCGELSGAADAEALPEQEAETTEGPEAEENAEGETESV